MKVEHLRILPAILLYCLGVVFAATPALADNNRAYFKTYGSDVMSGGWFANGAACDTSTTSNYQDPTFSNAGLGIGTNANSGGILAFAKTDGAGNSAGGASSQYGALSLGAVDGDSASGAVKGFYTGGAQAAGGAKAFNYLTFANTSGWGGNFDGSVRQSNCIADYYSKLPASATAKTTGDQLNSFYNTSGTYNISTVAAGTNYNLVSGPVAIPDGVKVSLFVNGNVYIGSNITYAGGNNANSIPKFALVVKGSIYIDPSVTRLDGFYIAQPSSVTAASSVNTDTGIIWTCHPNDQAPFDYTYPATGACHTNSLVINGAVVAKQVNFLRTKGDISSANTSEDTLAGGTGSSNIAEIINYTPQMFMGGGFFTTTSNTASGLPIDSIFSLPPVF